MRDVSPRTNIKIYRIYAIRFVRMYVRVLERPDLFIFDLPLRPRPPPPLSDVNQGTRRSLFATAIREHECVKDN